MNALALFALGRRLMKLGEEAMRGSGAPGVPAAVRLVVTDVFEHPGSSIGEIVARTGLPQSYVSETVGRMRRRGVVETEADPADGRRTLVRIGAEMPDRLRRRGTAPVEGVLADALGESDEQAVAEMAASLEQLLARLRAVSGPQR